MIANQSHLSVVLLFSPEHPALDAAQGRLLDYMSAVQTARTPLKHWSVLMTESHTQETE